MSIDRLEAESGDGTRRVTRDADLWTEPTSEWDEAVSLIQEARAAPGVNVTEAMYEAAMNVVRTVSLFFFFAYFACWCCWCCYCFRSIMLWGWLCIA